MTFDHSINLLTMLILGLLLYRTHAQSITRAIVDAEDKIVLRVMRRMERTKQPSQITVSVPQ